jgi:seryl-tRNA synthetase
MRLPRKSARRWPAKDQATADSLKAEVAKLKDELQAGEAKERELDEALKHALSVLPNIPLDDVPVGARTRADNVERSGFQVGEARSWLRDEGAFRTRRSAGHDGL